MSAQRIFLLVAGALMVLAGVLALFSPFLASLTAVLIVGWVLILAAIMHLIAAFRDAEDRWWNTGFGVLGLILGASFILNPVGGVITLTLYLGFVFAAMGAMQLWLAWKRRPQTPTWMLAISGVISLAVAVLIAVDLLAASAILPGIVLAIELISTGVALVMLRPAELPGPHGERDAGRDGTSATG